MAVFLKNMAVFSKKMAVFLKNMAIFSENVAIFFGLIEKDKILASDCLKPLMGYALHLRGVFTNKGGVRMVLPIIFKLSN